MIWFGVLSALFLAGALAFLLPPLLRRRPGAATVSRNAVNVNVYRDQLQELEADLAAGTLSSDQYDEARREIERRLLEDTGGGDPEAPLTTARGRIAAIASVVAVPVLAIGLYLTVGNPAGLLPDQVAGRDQGHTITPGELQVMVERLAARLKENPGDVNGWVMLARSYMVLERFKEAAGAFAKAVEGEPKNAQLLVDYADALAMSQGRDLSGEPEKLVLRALALDPDNVKALALAGTIAFHKKQYSEAVAHWQRMLGLVPPESETARAIKGSIAEAQALGGQAPPPMAKAGPPAAKPDAPRAGTAAARVAGSVALAPALSKRAAPDDTVFIFARAAEGPRVPLAVVRKRVSELPASFELDETMAMAPGMSLANFDRVVVSARVSKSGSPAAQAGDLEGVSAPVKVGAKGISVVIDKVLE